MKKIISLSPTKTDFGPLLFSGNLEQGLREASRLGYDGVELSLRDSRQIDRSWLKKRLAELKLRVYGIATGQTYYADGCGLFSFDRTKRAFTVARLRGHVDLASELGAVVIIGGIRGRLEEGTRAEQMAAGKDALREVALYAGARGVDLVLEPINRYETNVFNTLAEGLECIREMDLRNIGLLADTFHMNLEEGSYREALIQAGRNLKYVHLADSNRLAPGWGHIDFAPIVGALREIGFAGPVGIEVLPKPEDLKAARQGISFLHQIQA